MYTYENKWRWIWSRWYFVVCSAQEKWESSVALWLSVVILQIFYRYAVIHDTLSKITARHLQSPVSASLMFWNALLLYLLSITKFYRWSSLIQLCITEVSAEPQRTPFIDWSVIIVCCAASHHYSKDQEGTQNCLVWHLC